MNYEHPPKFKPLTLDPFDGTVDPVSHVQSFKPYMIIFSASDEMMCISFLLTLKNVASN